MTRWSTAHKRRKRQLARQVALEQQIKAAIAAVVRQAMRQLVEMVFGKLPNQPPAQQWASGGLVRVVPATPARISAEFVVPNRKA